MKHISSWKASARLGLATSLAWSKLGHKDIIYVAYGTNNNYNPIKNK